jgi:hypothetical protein
LAAELLFLQVEAVVPFLLTLEYQALLIAE